MKFTTSENKSFHGPRPWIDYGLDEEKSIKKYYEDEMYVWDADVCGDENVDIVFENGKAFRLDNHWWLEYSEKDECWSIPNEFYLKEIPLDEARCEKKYRDWLDLYKHNDFHPVYGKMIREARERKWRF